MILVPAGGEERMEESGRARIVTEREESARRPSRMGAPRLPLAYEGLESVL
jgi:hypothetical protein